MYRLKVREVAKERGISMSKLSRVSDVSYATIQEIYRNPTHDASLIIMDRIAGALGVSICDLIEEPGREVKK
jgi:transcriptional regulator with XRE-family HTH domain